jgi:predicted ribosome quality control (RQC) complex YloA/Tae2 family protein
MQQEFPRLGESNQKNLHLLATSRSSRLVTKLYSSTTPYRKDSPTSTDTTDESSAGAGAGDDSSISSSTCSSWDDEEPLEDHVRMEEEEVSPLLDEFETWSNALNQAIENLRKKRNSLESEVVKAEGIEGTVARAQLLVSNLYLFTRGVTSAQVQDWENEGREFLLELNTKKYDSANAEADALFAQARKLKRGSQVVSDLLEKTAVTWELLLEAKADLESALMMVEGDNNDNTANTTPPVIDQERMLLVQDRLIRTSRKTNFQVPSKEPKDGNDPAKRKGGRQTAKQKQPEIGTPASNLRKLISPGGCIILVGRNRRGNEHLSLTVARGNDIWMHSRGCPGAHVLIQNRRGSPKPTDACLQFGADLAIFYSDLRNEVKAEVTAAEPKHVQKPRGAPLGAVKLREEWKTFVGRPDRVPDELKEARDKSGQSDEYRSVDKAKHRRRTKQAAEEDRARRRKNNR